MSDTRMSNELDYNIENLDERVSKVDEIIRRHDNELVSYFDDYYNPSLNKSSRLSEHDPMCVQLERMADYLLYADKEEQKKDNKKKEKHLTRHQFDYRYKKEKNYGDLSDTEKSYSDMQNEKGKNYYLSNNTVIEESDRKKIPVLGEYGKMLGYLKFCIYTGYYPPKEYSDKYLSFSHLSTKQMNSLIEPYKVIRDEENPDGEVKVLLEKVSKKTIAQYRRIVESINKDEPVIKEMILGTIRFKNLTRSEKNINLTNFSFTNKDHVKVLIDNYSSLVEGSYEDTSGDVKLIMYILEDLIDSCGMNEYHKEILILHIDGLRQMDIADKIYREYGMSLTRQQISNIITKVIPDMIVKHYKECFEDWIFTFVKKGVYKTCSKCKENLIASELNFRRDKTGKYGFRGTCKRCDSD